MLHCWADGKGGQKVEDTGPLTRKRMETIDEEVTDHALAFIDKTHNEGKPFFVWYNTTAMHFRTHPAGKHKGKSGGQGDYHDVMVAHDENIGRMLAKLDELGIAGDTIVMYSTDNGPHYRRWLVAGLTFQLAADIIATSVAPGWEEVGKLGAIAVIRTFLNFFLERDLAELRDIEPVGASRSGLRD